MNTHSDIGSELSNILFWDVDKNDIDFDKHATFIIQRVLEYGESAISHTKKEDYRCYHTAQSSPTPWNS